MKTLLRFSTEQSDSCQVSCSCSSFFPNFTPSLLLPLFHLLGFLLLFLGYHNTFQQPSPRTRNSSLTPVSPVLKPFGGRAALQQPLSSNRFPHPEELGCWINSFSTLFPHVLLTVPGPQPIPPEHNPTRAPSTCRSSAPTLSSVLNTASTAQTSLLTSNRCFQGTISRTKSQRAEAVGA